METIWYPYRATLCPRHQTRLQELMFDLPGLALLDLALLGLASISLIFLSSYSFHLEMKIPPCLCIFEYVTSISYRHSQLICLEFQEKIETWDFQQY